MMRAIKFILALALVQAVAGREQQGLRATAGGDECVKAAVAKGLKTDRGDDCSKAGMTDDDIDIACNRAMQTPGAADKTGCKCAMAGTKIACKSGLAAGPGTTVFAEQPSQNKCFKDGKPLYISGGVRSQRNRQLIETGTENIHCPHGLRNLVVRVALCCTPIVETYRWLILCLDICF
jgi:hypothetical protein